MADIAFALNYTNLYLIDITPEADEPTWARVGAGINKADFDGNEESDNDPYYDGDGMAYTEVTGGQLSISFSGHRKYGDPAQDYVAGLQAQYGAKRHTNFRRIAPDGQVTEGDVTIANIKPGGGDPNKKGDFGFDVRFNGMPSIVEGDASAFPEAVALDAVTLAVGETVTLSPVVTPATANAACVYGVKNDAVATVDASGALTGVSAGTTKVSVKSVVLPSVRIEVDVTVTEAGQEEQAETPDASLSALSIGSLTLAPAFDADTTSYSASTENATNTITATPADEGATVAITVGETPVESGSAATWAAGENTVTVVVTNGAATKTYTVTVTKSE